MASGSVWATKQVPVSERDGGGRGGICSKKEREREVEVPFLGQK